MPGAHPGDASRESLQGLLRDVRAEAQNLDSLLIEIQAKAALIDREVRSQEVAAALEYGAPIFDANRAKIEQRLLEVRSVLDQNAHLYDTAGDEIAHIENFWERATHGWPQVGAPLDEVLQRAATADGWLNDLIYHTGLVTIPPRVNQHLALLSVGQPLDFHDAFRDELPKDEHRAALLRYIQAHPGSIYGVVDVERGLIYHASPHQRRRLASYLLIVLTLVLGVGVAVAVANMGAWFGLSAWPVAPPRLGNLLVGYLFLVLGAMVHVGVDALKQRRAQPGTTLLALEHGLLWVHVKEVPIIVGIVSLWVGLIGLAFWRPEIDWQTAFFVGYSIDSFVDLFLQRFAQATTARTEALRGQVA
jgi:hypothetical protein